MKKLRNPIEDNEEFQKNDNSDVILIVKNFIEKFGFDQGFDSLERINFAFDLILEEVQELAAAIYERDPEETVDALGDISWLCDKLMIQLGVDPIIVRNEIGRANMTKERGVKPGREQSHGYDVIKPTGWQPPNHSNNWGKLEEIYNGDSKRI